MGNSSEGEPIIVVGGGAKGERVKGRRVKDEGVEIRWLLLSVFGQTVGSGALGKRKQ
jgi:hypothetical protein